MSQDAYQQIDHPFGIAISISSTDREAAESELHKLCEKLKKAKLTKALDENWGSSWGQGTHLGCSIRVKSPAQPRLTDEELLKLREILK